MKQPQTKTSGKYLLNQLHLNPPRSDPRQVLQRLPQKGGGGQSFETPCIEPPICHK